MKYEKEAVILPKEINEALTQYEYLVMGVLGARGISFVAQLTLEARNRDNVLLEEKQTINARNLTIRSDHTMRPMLLSEIEAFLAHLRFIFDYPFDLIGDSEVYDELIVSQFTHAEFVALCCYIESETKGAGIALYLGERK